MSGQSSLQGEWSGQASGQVGQGEWSLAGLGMDHGRPRPGLMVNAPTQLGKVSQPIIRAIRQSAIRLLEPERAVWDSKHPSLGVSSARSVVQRATPNRMLTRSGRAGAAVIINMASC